MRRPCFANKLGEALYGKQQPSAGADAGGQGGQGTQGGKPDGGKGGENVVDADFEEVKDDKKKSA